MNQKETPVYRITDLHESDRPRERLKSLGPEALSNAELLAILLRTGLPGENVIQVGQRLLQTFGGLSGLHRVAFDELCAQRGVGEAKAAQIKAAIELGRRLSQKGEDDRPLISAPESAAELISYEMSALEQEHLRVLLLNTRNRLIDICEVYRGSVNSAQVRVAEVFRDAVRRNAISIIVAHNHPSGDPTPSPEDIALTRSLIQAGKLLGIEVLDHLIIGRSRFVSLKREGLI
ncbi:MAG: DNA repair protein RadC [Anaerolineales bacterium]